MREKRKVLARTMSFSAGSVMIAGLAVLASGPITAQGEEVSGRDRVEVTGSRIKRASIEDAMPLIVIDRETIDSSGESNAADLIRNLPLNITGSYRPQSGTAYRGVSVVDLRGLGPEYTLVLINGRRMPKAPLSGVASDLSLIPLGAIERIEVLADGASAVYGSDAIAGVVNVVLRSDFEGVELMVGRADVNPRGGDRRDGHAIFGAASDTSSLIGGVSTNSRDLIFGRDFFWTPPEGSTLYGNNFTTLEGGFDNFNFTALPGACDFPEQPAFYLSPEAGSLACLYDFRLESADEASIRNQSLFLRGSHRFANDWSVFSDALVAKTRSFGRQAPIGDSSFFHAPISADSLNNPTNPDSPMYDPALGLDPQPVNIWHRFDALGNRDNQVDSELYDLLVGAQGLVGPVEVELGARWTRNKVFDVGYNYLLGSSAWAYIEDGRYDVSDPYSSPEHVLNAMKATTSRVSVLDQNEVFALAAFDAGAIGGAPIQWAFGVEYREEIFNDQYDSLSEAGQLAGSIGNSADDERDVTSLFGEALLQVMENLEFLVAARYDDYSDYGADFSPRVSFRYQPLDGYVLRGSWGEDFRAPDFQALNLHEFSSIQQVSDPLTCPPPQVCGVQFNVLQIANPELDSEESEQYSLGIAVAPTDWFSGSLDYSNIEVRDQIRYFTAQALVNRDAAGLSVPRGLGVVREESGNIIRIDTGLGNEGQVNASYFDLKLRASFDLFGGHLFHNLHAVRMQTLSVDGGRQQVRDPGVPRYRATLQNRYAWGDFSFAYNLNYISGQCDRIELDGCIGRVPSWTTHDVQGNYFTRWNGQITIGARNLWSRQPPLFLGDIGVRDYNFDLHDAYGRITYVRYTQRF